MLILLMIVQGALGLTLGLMGISFESPYFWAIEVIALCHSLVGYLYVTKMPQVSSDTKRKEEKGIVG